MWNSIESWKIPKRTKRYYINVSGAFLRLFRADRLGPSGILGEENEESGKWRKF